MNSREKQSLIAALVSRGFYVIGEVGPDRSCAAPGADISDRPGESSVAEQTQEPQAAANCC